MQDYSRKVGTACLVLIVMLIVMGYIPALSIGWIDMRRIDILSQIRSAEGDVALSDDDLLFPNYDVPTPEAVALELDEEEYEIDMQQVSATVAEAYELVAMHTPESDQAAKESPARQTAAPAVADVVKAEAVAEEMAEEEALKTIDTTRLLPHAKLTLIEDFDTTGNNPLHRFYAKLNHANSTVRIAFLGDSFVEGDILTCDLREAMQSRYGGCGAGFAPVDSPLTRYRRSVNTTSSGWTTFNIMQKRTTPEDLASNYFVSGWVSRPENGASTVWEGSEARKFVDEWGGVHLIFISRDAATIETTINGRADKTYRVEAKEIVQQIEVKRGGMSSFGFKVTSGGERFIGYGAIFDGGEEGGVVVDNYSVRSNNGQAMLWTNPAINVQVDRLVEGYDLVILQYGLNIMQKGVNNYTRYGEQIEKMIAYVRQCFPQAAVLVMGVSDRSMKENGTYVAMSEASGLTRYQRDAARKSGAAFWSTYDAMAAQGGMENFVKQGWAGKDYTHINLGGGRQVAMALTDALIYDHYKSCPPVVRKEYENVIPQGATTLIGKDVEVPAINPSVE
ncbi:MAG: hypothetical protein SNG02_03560 [Rikenellaceae bacterium]